MSEYYNPNLLTSLDNSNVPPNFRDHNSTVTESQKLSAQSLGRWLEMDSDRSMGAANLPGKVRRRPPPRSDHVKHRRTRSGCYTCRSRRVKACLPLSMSSNEVC